MSISAVAADVWNGTYIARIQDALGNAGASLTTTPGSSTGVIAGTPTGEGLKILAAQAAAASQAQPKGTASLAQDTVSLSPAAQAALTRQSIALKLLQPPDGKATSDSKDTGATRTTPATPATPAPAPTATDSVNASDVTSLAREDPTQVIDDALNATHAALSDPNFFYDYANADKQNLPLLASGIDPDAQGAFLAAFSSRSLTIRNVADIPGYQSPDQTVITGTSESISGAPGVSATPTGRTGDTYAMEVGFGVGAILVSWSLNPQDATAPG